jgi:hypothetical protein
MNRLHTTICELVSREAANESARLISCGPVLPNSSTFVATLERDGLKITRNVIAIVTESSVGIYMTGMPFPTKMNG